MPKLQIDTKPLADQLLSFRKVKSELENIATREGKLRREIDDFLESGDLTAEEAGKVLAGKRIQLDLCEPLRKRTNLKLAASAEALVDYVEEFERSLICWSDADKELFAASFAKANRPDFPIEISPNGERRDRAAEIARQSPSLSCLPRGTQELVNTTLPSNPRDEGNPIKFDIALEARAQELLDLSSAWQKSGGPVAFTRAKIAANPSFETA